jgi:hypothetical protein
MGIIGGNLHYNFPGKLVLLSIPRIPNYFNVIRNTKDFFLSNYSIIKTA